MYFVRTCMVLIINNSIVLLKCDCFDKFVSPAGVWSSQKLPLVKSCPVCKALYTTRGWICRTGAISKDRVMTTAEYVSYCFTAGHVIGLID